MFVALSVLGNWGLVWIVLALLGAVVWLRPLLFPLALAAVGAADLLATVGKRLTDRDRPYVPEPEP